MNLNVWNIKDLFSIPPGTGPGKSSGKNSSGDHSSLTDSQFLFSSQFCPDNSQASTTDYKQLKNSQHNSQDNEPSVLRKYQSKPSLYSNEGKAGDSFRLFGSAKHKDILDQFEESKKKAKEKLENDQLNNMISSLQLTIQELKMAFCQIEENTNLRCKCIMDSVEAVKAVQDNTASHCESILKALSARCNVEQALVDIEQKVQTNDEEMTNLKSNVQLLLSNMDELKSQQCEQQVILTEKLGWLSDYIKSSENKIISELQKINLLPVFTHGWKDITTQTSPITSLNILPKDRTKSHLKITQNAPVTSSVSKDKVQRTVSETSTVYSLAFPGSVSAPVKTLRSFNLKSINCVNNSWTGYKSSEISQTSPQRLTSTPLDLSQVQDVKKNDIWVSGRLKHMPTTRHEDRDSSKKETRLTEAVDPSCGKESPLLGSVAKKKSQKRGTASKAKTLTRKKRSKKTDTGPISRRLANQVNFGNKSVGLDRENSFTDSQQDRITHHAERRVSSLPTIHAPVRKVQKKNRNTCSILCSHETMQQQSSTKKPSYARDMVGVYKSQVVRWDLSRQESDDLHYTAKNGNHMAWLCPSSPLLDNSPPQPLVQAKGKDFLSLFFDSSDDSN
ncbi:interactor of HORMAD1 protein 1 [Pelodytes ibericus]